MTNAEFKELMKASIKLTFEQGSDSIWVQGVKHALGSLGPDDWDDVLDYMWWDMLRKGILPSNLSYPPLVRDAGS